MAAPRNVRPADLGGEPSEICNSAGNSLYRVAELEWSKPVQWEKGANAPIRSFDEPLIYVLVHNHGLAAFRDRIEYVGLTIKPKTRFYNHATAKALRDKRGQLGISVAPINFIHGRNYKNNTKKACEEIEHLLIWVLDPPENERKLYTIPGMGTGGANAWHLQNKGYRFAGQMPKEIVFPWILVKSGRDRSAK